jgi:hypothetical protein
MAVYPHHCPHIPFMKPRRKLGNGNKSVSTVVDELLIAIDATNQSYLILPAPPPVPMFPARHRPIIEAFCFSRRLPRCRAASVSIQTENYTDNGYDP